MEACDLLCEEADGKTREEAVKLLSDESSVCSRLFRLALAKLFLPENQAHSLPAKKIQSVIDEAFRKCTHGLLTVLFRIIEAEKTLITTNTGEGGGHRKCKGHAKVDRTGISAQKKGRRVSFNTFDLSTVDTPSLQRKGSNKQMDDLLLSMHGVLRAMEELKEACCLEQEMM